MARRATFIKENLQDSDFALFVDAGGFNRGIGDISNLKNEYLLKAMGDIGCRIFNLSMRDFTNGGQVLLDAAKKSNVELLASNTFYKDSDKPFTGPYQIVKLKPLKGKNPGIKNIKAGIIGLTDEQNMMFSSRLQEPILYSKNPLEVAKKLVPKVKKESDLVVMLYHGSYSAAKEIITTVPGVDVLIVGGQYYMINDRENLDAVIASTSSMGKYCGILELKLDGDLNITGHSKQSVALNEDIIDDPEMLELLKDFDKKQAELGNQASGVSAH